jgi:hypothetical protein
MTGVTDVTGPVSTSLAVDVAKAVGVCVRPLLRKVTDRATGTVTTVPIPCGATRETVCPPCADKARRLRIQQCREGWHLAEDPPRPDPDSAADDDSFEEEDPEADQAAVADGERRSRSTRRRDELPDLPRVPMADRTTGQAFTDPRTGRTYRPRMFLTLTLPSYGRVVPGQGVPRDPARYGYRRAALDALLFARLVDRFWQNLRRCAGYRVQYFAAVEPQRRLAPHLHAAVRGAIPRATIKAVAKATYHAVWWPPINRVVYDGHRLPVWDRQQEGYVDPDTGTPLTTWQQALDALDAAPGAKPMHVLRFGRQLDIKGLLAGSPDADRAVRYLCKYLTKSIAHTYTAPTVTDQQREDGDGHALSYAAHIDRIHHQVRWLPCSPRCANWLRHGIQPQDAGPGLAPGACPAKAHDREHLGLGGRRVLVSRQWSGKTLAEHKADRAAVVRQALQAAGLDAPDADRMAVDALAADRQPRFIWEDVPVPERDYAAAIAASIRQAKRWREQYQHAKTVAAQRDGPPGTPVDSHSANDERRRAA